MRLFSWALVLVLSSTLSAAWPHAAHDTHENSPPASQEELVELHSVSGSVTLFAGTKDFPSSLTGLYKGRDSQINVSKAGKNIKVSGSYQDKDTVRVEETSASGATYTFVLPVIRSVITSLTSNIKATDTNRSIRGIFSGALSRISSLTSIISETQVNIVKDISVTKLSARRINNQATVIGSFIQKGSSARGRFKLVFTE